MKVAELRSACEARGLDSAGLKKDLQERLQESLDMEMMGGEGDAASAEASAEEAAPAEEEAAPAEDASAEEEAPAEGDAEADEAEAVEEEAPAAAAEEEEEEVLDEAEQKKKARVERFGGTYVSPREAAKAAAAKKGGKKGGKSGKGGKGVCFAFQKGECERGDECRFAHVKDASAVAGGAGGAGKSRTACRGCGEEGHFKRDCPKGGSSNGGKSAKGGGKGVCFAFQKGECERGDECRFAHVKDASAVAGGAGGQKRKGLSAEQQKKIADRGARFGTASKGDESNAKKQKREERFAKPALSAEEQAKRDARMARFKTA